MRAPLLLQRVLFAFTVSAALINNTPALASNVGTFTASTPEGFDQLTAQRNVVLDAYFGGRKLGEVRATIRLGFVTFTDPQSLVSMVPDVRLLAPLVDALTGPLPANVSLACGPTPREGCGTVKPDRAGVILDEDRFRVDLFIHPDLMSQPDPAATYYLAPPAEEPSLVSLFGATLSGSSRRGTSWHLQNRSIAAVGDYRMRIDSSVTDVAGVTFDNLTVETDRRDWRIRGGIFWAPGSELIGRRRMVGVGAATQLDTRENKTSLLGSPLEIFLQQAAKVDILIDGRIASSMIYPAGSRLIDTSMLPNGSYELVLRIREDGRPARDEQRFFSKGSAMAPLGRPLFSAFVGLLPSSGRGLSVNGKNIFYEASAAYRITPSFGIDAVVLGTQRKAILETGVVHHSNLAQIRVGALISTLGDHGVAIRATTIGKGPASLSFDLRKITSSDGRPLLPFNTSSGTFSEEAKLGFSDRGSFAQALSTFSYRFHKATLHVAGLYRKNNGEKSDYSVGASVEVPVVRSNRWDLQMSADVRKTERDVSSFIGFRFLASRGNVALSGSAGIVRQNVHGPSANELVGEAQASWHRQLHDQTQLSNNVAIGQNVDGAYSRASAHMRSRSFNSRADVLHQFGESSTTQFAATIDMGIVATSSGVAIAGREMNDTGIWVSVTGGGLDQQFDVLVDDVIRGKVADGERLVVFLQPYQRYAVRVRSRDAQISGFDSAARMVTLYPGNVAQLNWSVTPLFVLFGRAVGEDGKPVADADVSGSHGVSRTDDGGYFQIETRRGEQLRVNRENSSICTISIAAARPVDGFVSSGDQICL